MVTKLFECMRQPNSADSSEGVEVHIPVADTREEFLRAALKYVYCVVSQVCHC